MDQSLIIALKDVESTYKAKGQEQLHLRSINLSITAGEILAVVGRNGADKSALLRCIGLLDRPLTGIISIDNKNLTFLASKELCNERRSIGYISAKPEFLNSKTILKNIALPLQIQGFNKDEISALVEQALLKVGLEAKTHSYPQSLSPLQKIQADIARAIVNSPKILLCEDIFSGLAQTSVDLLSNLLQTLRQESRLTIVITTNDAEIIKTMCHSVVIMQQGTIVDRCSVYDLFTNPISDVAKEFIRFTTKHELPYSVRKKIIPTGTDKHHALVRINFSDCLAPEEILSNTLEAHELKMNIIQAYQEKIQDRLLNIMLIEIYGYHKIISDAVKFLNTNGLQSEIIGYVPNID